MQSKPFLLKCSAFLLLAAFFLLLQELPLWSTEVPSVTVGATASSSIELSIDGGVNQFGKRTVVVGNAIDFGNVSFTHPELIANGDAYLENGYLRLEAIFEVGLVFGGATAVDLTLKKIDPSQHSFHNTHYSLSTNRSDILEPIYEDPRSNHLTRLVSSSTLALRTVMEISPQQQGRLADRFRLEANAL